MGDDVGEPYAYAKFHYDMFTRFAPPNMILNPPTVKTTAPIFTINTLKKIDMTS